MFIKSLILVLITINWYYHYKHILEVECNGKTYQWVMDSKEFNNTKEKEYINWFETIKTKCEENTNET